MEPRWKKILKYTFFIFVAIALVCWVIIIVLLATNYDSPKLDPTIKVLRLVGSLSAIPVIINGFVYDYLKRKERKAKLKEKEETSE